MVKRNVRQKEKTFWTSSLARMCYHLSNSCNSAYNEAYKSVCKKSKTVALKMMKMTMLIASTVVENGSVVLEKSIFLNLLHSLRRAQSSTEEKIKTKARIRHCNGVLADT